MKKSSLLLPFTFGHFANDFAPCTIWLIAPAVAVAMDLSPAEVGLLITIQGVGAAAAYFPAGLIADHVSNRGRLLVATFWWVAIGYVAASLAPGFWTFAILLAIAGMGDAAWHPIATGILVREHTSRRAQALGIHAMGGAFAEVLAPIAVGLLLAYVDWRVALQLTVLPAVLMGLLFIRVARKVPPTTRRRVTRAALFEVWQTWKHPNGLKVIALLGASNVALMALLSMTPLFLQTVHGLTPVETGLAFSVMILLGALAQPVIGRVSDLTGRRSIILAGNAIAAVAVAGVWLSTSLTVIVTLLVVSIGVLVAIRSVLLAAAIEHAGGREGTTLGITFALMDGIGAMGAVLAGIVGNIDLAHTYLLAAGLSIAAVVIGSRVRFQERPPAAIAPAMPTKASTIARTRDGPKAL
jgi:FSR family fosmidomycin resistance protein-like MFS transporter